MQNKINQAQNRLKDIIDKINSNQKELAPSEIEDYCQFLFNYDKPDTLPEICQDFKFISLYETYQDDLKFNSRYYKLVSGLSDEKYGAFLEKSSEIDPIISNDKYNLHLVEQILDMAKKMGILREVPMQEIRQDKIYLMEIADNWKSIINNLRHSNQNLKTISEETREAIRTLEKENKKQQYSGSDLDFDIRLSLWKSKYIL